MTRGFKVRVSIPRENVFSPGNTLYLVAGQVHSRWCDVKAWGGCFQIRRRPRHLTAVKKNEVCTNIYLKLLQSETLI